MIRKNALLQSVVLAAFVFLTAEPAMAQISGLDALVGKISEFNTWLVTLGGVLAVTGFIRVCMAILIGFGNAVGAAVMLGGGLAVAAAPQIVGFFVGA